ncbi:33761_t:CDS:2, partial [Gigaspora margarita]
AHDIEANAEICDLTIAENETIQNFSEISESDESNETEAYSTDEDNSYEIHYGVFIKIDGKFQPAKWYTIIISEVDEFLAEIHNNDNGSETEIDTSEDNTMKVYKNKNKIPKISNLTSEETQMAKNVLEIQTANH